MKSNSQKSTIPALQFQMKIGKLLIGFLRGKINSSGYWKPGGPVSITQVPYPSLIADDWVIVKTVYCGICGSDMTELMLKGARDNPIRSLISFPQIMGHEPVGIIHKTGPKVTRIKVGDRVAISPWFPCHPRGISPECPRCQQGDYTHCQNFLRGQLPAGMFLGVTKGFGGFSPYIPVHESQCFEIPDIVSFDQAVFADPFSVAFHACNTLDPDSNSTILVFGIGVIGLLTIICLKTLYNIQNIIAVGRYPFQKELALQFSAKHVFMSQGEKLIEEVAAYMEAELYKPEKGLIWSIDGVDGIIDTIASATTLEVCVRVLTAQGHLVFLGVNIPKRYENTPHYFKELEIIGSNAYGIESYQGKRAHAFEFFLNFLTERKIDMTPLITHKFTLKDYQKAFNILANKSESKAVKVIFDFTQK